MNRRIVIVLVTLVALTAWAWCAPAYRLVDSGWHSNKKLGLQWDSYTICNRWDDIGSFEPFEGDVNNANKLKDQFATGKYKAVLVSVSLRNDSGKPMRLGYMVGWSDQDSNSELWLAGTDGSAFSSTQAFNVGNSFFGAMTAGSGLTRYLRGGLPLVQDCKPSEAIRGNVVFIVPTAFVPKMLYVHTGPGLWFGDEKLEIPLQGVGGANVSPGTSPGGGGTGPGATSAGDATMFPAVSGRWVGDGTVLLMSQELSTGKPVPVAGVWLKPGASAGADAIQAYLRQGTVDPASGALTFTYVAAGSDQGKTAHFQIGGDGRSLSGPQGADLGLANQWRRQTLKDALDGSDRAIVYGIYFDQAGLVRTASQPALVEVARILHDSPVSLRIEVYGDDQALTQKVADAVKNYLVEHYNTSIGRLEAVGCGSDHPLADNSTDEGKLLNRRVEIVKQ